MASFGKLQLLLSQHCTITLVMTGPSAQVNTLKTSLAAQQEGLEAAHAALFSATEQLQKEMTSTEADADRDASSSQAEAASQDAAGQQQPASLAAELRAAEAAIRRAVEQMQAQVLHHKAAMSEAATGTSRELQALTDVHQAHLTALGNLHTEQVQGLQQKLSQAQEAAEGLQGSLQHTAAESLRMQQAAEADQGRAADAHAAEMRLATELALQVQAALGLSQTEAASCRQQLDSRVAALQAAQQALQAQQAAAHELEERVALGGQLALKASANHASQVQYRICCYCLWSLACAADKLLLYELLQLLTASLQILSWCVCVCVCVCVGTRILSHSNRM